MAHTRKTTANRPSESNREFVTNSRGEKVRNVAYVPPEKNTGGISSHDVSQDFSAHYADEPTSVDQVTNQYGEIVDLDEEIKKQYNTEFGYITKAGPICDEGLHPDVDYPSAILGDEPSDYMMWLWYRDQCRQDGDELDEMMDFEDYSGSQDQMFELQQQQEWDAENVNNLVNEWADREAKLTDENGLYVENYVRIKGSNMGWLHKDGGDLMTLDDFTKDPIHNIAPNTYDFEQRWEQGADGKLYISQSHHDAMGELYEVEVGPLTDEEKEYLGIEY